MASLWKPLKNIFDVFQSIFVIFAMLSLSCLWLMGASLHWLPSYLSMIDQYGSYQALVFNMDERQKMRSQHAIGYAMEMLKLVTGKVWKSVISRLNQIRCLLVRMESLKYAFSLMSVNACLKFSQSSEELLKPRRKIHAIICINLWNKHFSICRQGGEWGYNYWGHCLNTTAGIYPYGNQRNPVIDSYYLCGGLYKNITNNPRF